MKKIIFAFVFLIFQQAFSNNFFNVSLNENEKLEGSSSIVLNKTTSIHFLFIKNTNTKKHLIRPFFVDDNKKVSLLEDAVFEEKINLISSHHNGNVVTLGNYDSENETLYLIDFDIDGKKNVVKTDFEYKKPDLVFSLDGKSVYVQIAEDYKIIYTQSITNTNQINRKNFYPSDDVLKGFKKMARSNAFNPLPPLQAINQNEFVKNGSIGKRNVYLINNKLIFVSSLNPLKSDVFSFDLNDEKDISNSAFDLFFPTSGQNQNNYLFDDNLALISSSKEDLLFVAYSIKTKSMLKEFSLVEKLAGKINTDLFLKEAKKSNLKVTMTFNKTKNSNYLVTLERVNQAVYSYNDMMWFHNQMMMQQMMMQQQQMRAMQQTHFGPNDTFFNNIYLEDKNESLTFYMDANFNIIDEDKSGTVFKYFDKDALLKTYNDNKNINELSAAFLDNEFRFVYQNKDSKTISIGYETIR